MTDRTFAHANTLKAGDVVIERTDRGTVKSRSRVVTTGPCNDAHHVHLQLTSERGTYRTACYFGETRLEADLAVFFAEHRQVAQ